MNLQENYIKYYFFSKKRILEDIEVEHNINLDAQVYKDNDSYKLLNVADERYVLNVNVIDAFVINPRKLKLYESGLDDVNDLDEYISYDSIDQHDKINIKLKDDEHLLEINDQRFFSDLNQLIDDYNSRKYDCIEVLLPNLDYIYYEYDFVDKLMDILHNAFPDDVSVVEYIETVEES